MLMDIGFGNHFTSLFTHCSGGEHTLVLFPVLTTWFEFPWIIILQALRTYWPCVVLCACTARVTVVGLVCVCVCVRWLTSHFPNEQSCYKEMCGIWMSNFMWVFLYNVCIQELLGETWVKKPIGNFMAAKHWRFLGVCQQHLIALL